MNVLFTFKRETDKFWIYTLQPVSGLKVDSDTEIRVRRADRMVHGADFTKAGSNGTKRIDNFLRGGVTEYIELMKKHITTTMLGEASQQSTVLDRQVKNS